MHTLIIDGVRTKGPRALRGDLIGLSKEELIEQNWYEVEGFYYNKLTHTRSETFEIIDGVATWTLTPRPEADVLADRQEMAKESINRSTTKEIQAQYPIEEQLQLIVKGLRLVRKEGKGNITAEEQAVLDGLETVADTMEVKRIEENSKKTDIDLCNTVQELDDLLKTWYPEEI